MCFKDETNHQGRWISQNERWNEMCVPITKLAELNIPIIMFTTTYSSEFLSISFRYLIIFFETDVPISTFT